MKKNILAENMRRFGTKNLNENLNNYVSINYQELMRELGEVYDEIQNDLERAGKYDQVNSTPESRKTVFIKGIADRNNDSSWPAWLTTQFKTVNIKGPVAGQPQTQTVSASEKDVSTLAQEYTDQFAGGKLSDSAKISIASALVPNTMKK